MATYSANADVDPHLVLKDGTRLRHEPSLRLWNHSPTGFSWGYGGSGPAQLALALLYDVTGNEKIAIPLYQDFKWQFVARWGEQWQITSKEIRAWVAEQPITQTELRLAEETRNEPNHDDTQVD